MKEHKFLQDKEHKFYEAAARTAAGVSYQNSCYIKFAIKKKVTVNKGEQIENLQNDILEEFLFSLKKRVIHQMTLE